MCGRFVSARKRLELLEKFAAERDSVGEDRNPDYNVAPTKRIYTVREYDRSDGPPPLGKQSANCGWCAGAWSRRGPRTPRAARG